MLINLLGLKGLMNFISANMYSQPELAFSVTRSINVANTKFCRICIVFLNSRRFCQNQDLSNRC